MAARAPLRWPTSIMAGPELDTLHFRPKGAINRAQAAVALARMPAVPSGTTTGQFADVPARCE